MCNGKEFSLDAIFCGASATPAWVVSSGFVVETPRCDSPQPVLCCDFPP